MRELAHLLRREWINQATRPALFVLCIAYWVISGFIAFNVLLDAAVVTLMPYFQIAPVLFLLFTLSITTGQLNQRSDSMDLLRLMPVSPAAVVTARFLVVLSILLVALLGASLVPAAVSFADWGRFDTGQLISANAGLFLLGGAFAAVGLAVGAYSRSQTAAFLVSFVVVFLFWIPDRFLPLAPEGLRGALSQLAFNTHLANWSRGILWLPDLAYFLIFAFVGITLAQVGWESWRFRRPWPRRITWKLPAGVLLLVLFQLVALRFPLRLDLTSEGLHTLDPESVKVVKSLKKDVRLLFFRSKKLPRELVQTATDVDALLREYAVLSPRLVVQILEPDADPDAAALSRSYGISEMEIGRRSATESTVNRVTFGLALVSGDTVETISDVTDPRTLEYEITFRLKRFLTGRKKIVFTTGHGEFPEKDGDPRGGFDRLFAAVTEFELIRQKGPLPEDTAVLVVAGPIVAFSDEAWEQVGAFARQGKPVLILADGMMFRNNMSLKGVARHWVPNPALAERLKTWGIILGDDMILSYQAPQVSVSQHKVVTFPLMPMVDVSRKLSIMPFTLSSVRLESPTHLSLQRRLRTDPGSWRHTRAYEENLEWPKTDDRGPFDVGLFLRGAPGKDLPASARVVVLGDSDLFRDYSFQTVNTHLLFFRQILDYLLDDHSLAHLRLKGRGVERLKLAGKPSPALVMTLAIGVPVLLLLAFAGIILLRRRKN
ncbi:MAG: hypothetical protein CVU65_16370 [Deltaproteobacteria bacterium HGW-Deltaproteobacteria-22]|nr:MAG: hypothetical protein CVU65_16370 [Deltaproteobacteria bacterium HGW-Deltaproteobacteria-22]